MPDPTNEPNPMPREGLIPDPLKPETEQILGTTAQSGDLQPVPPKWRRFYDSLRKRRDELIDATGDLRDKAREMQPDALQDEPAEIGTENYLRDYLLGTASADQEMLSEIDEALSRIEAGVYGICELTGKPIPEERLEAIPWTRFTLEAEKELESRGDAIKASLGPRGGLRKRGTEPPGPRREQEESR